MEQSIVHLVPVREMLKHRAKVRYSWYATHTTLPKLKGQLEDTFYTPFLVCDGDDLCVYMLILLQC